MFKMVVLIAIFNGIFSPTVLELLTIASFWVPGFTPPNLNVLYYMSSLILSSLTLLISGVPVALYERFSKRPNMVFAEGLWLIIVILLSWPAFLRGFSFIF